MREFSVFFWVLALVFLCIGMLDYFNVLTLPSFLSIDSEKELLWSIIVFIAATITIGISYIIDE